MLASDVGAGRSDGRDVGPLLVTWSPDTCAVLDAISSQLLPEMRLPVVEPPVDGIDIVMLLVGIGPPALATCCVVCSPGKLGLPLPPALLFLSSPELMTRTTAVTMPAMTTTAPRMIHGSVFFF